MYLPKFRATGTSSCDEPAECVQALKCLHVSPHSSASLGRFVSRYWWAQSNSWMFRTTECLHFKSNIYCSHRHHSFQWGWTSPRQLRPSGTFTWCVVRTYWSWLKLSSTANIWVYRPSWSVPPEVVLIQLYLHRRLKSLNIWTWMLWWVCCGEYHLCYGLLGLSHQDKKDVRRLNELIRSSGSVIAQVICMRRRRRRGYRPNCHREQWVSPPV